MVKTYTRISLFYFFILEKMHIYFIDFLINRVNSSRKLSIKNYEIDENIPINIKIELNNAFLKDRNANGLLSQLPNYIKKKSNKTTEEDIAITKENELKFANSWLNALDLQLARVSQQTISLGSLIQEQFSLTIVISNSLKILILCILFPFRIN